MMEKMPRCKVEKEFDRRRAAEIIKNMENQNYSLSICEWGCRAFVSVTGSAMQNQNIDSMADFLDDGGCEALIDVMKKHALVSEKIAAFSCLTISILSWSLRDMQEFLGGIGACEEVVFATSMHIGDPLVSEYGSAAIGLLAKNNISNSLLLSQAGACDVISQVANFGFSLRQENCSEVATNVCFAFAHLCEARNASQLLECGAPCLVVKLLDLHMANKDFLGAATKAICALSSLNGKHREEIGRVGGCELIIKVISTPDIPVAVIQEACEAIMHLSLNPNNNPKFNAAGACETLVDALKVHLMEYHCGAEVCSGAILNLVTYGVSAKDNREEFRRVGAVPQLRGAQMSTKASYRARENIISLLDILGAEVVPGSTSNSGAVNNLYKPSSDTGRFVSVLHASEMKGDTIPLSVEVREEIVMNIATQDGTGADDLLMDDKLQMRESEELREIGLYSSLSQQKPKKSAHISRSNSYSHLNSNARSSSSGGASKGMLSSSSLDDSRLGENTSMIGTTAAAAAAAAVDVEAAVMTMDSRSSTGEIRSIPDVRSLDYSEFYRRSSNGSDNDFAGDIAIVSNKNGVYEL